MCSCLPSAYNCLINLVALTGANKIAKVFPPQPLIISNDAGELKDILLLHRTHSIMNNKSHLISIWRFYLNEVTSNSPYKFLPSEKECLSKVFLFFFCWWFVHLKILKSIFMDLIFLCDKSFSTLMNDACRSQKTIRLPLYSGMISLYALHTSLCHHITFLCSCKLLFTLASRL